jgi:adenosylcobinamide-GDP ribazoletransferase
MRLAQDLVSAFGLLTRLPLPKAAAGSGLAEGVWAWPVVGAVIGLIGGIVYTVAAVVHLSPWLCAVLAVFAMIIATGGLHEDGLADTADGMGGGQTAEPRLAIMQDSRIGSFGALALIASVGLRAGALVQLAEPRLVIPALVVAAMAGRSAMPGVVILSAPARPGGLGASLGLLARPRVYAGWAIAVAISLLLMPHGLGRAAAATVIIAFAMAAFGRRTIRGYTGDTLGATEQLGECAVLLVLAAAAGQIAVI